MITDNCFWWNEQIWAWWRKNFDKRLHWTEGEKESIAIFNKTEDWVYDEIIEENEQFFSETLHVFLEQYK